MTINSCGSRGISYYPKSGSRGRRDRSRLRRWASAREGSKPLANRHAVNRACVRHHKPLVSGAAVRFDGEVSVFDLRDELSPCYQCLFPENAELEEVRCAVMGVFAPLPGIIGTVQAAEALKLLAGAGETLQGRLLILDALAMQWRTVKLAKDPVRAVCARVIA